MKKLITKIFILSSLFILFGSAQVFAQDDTEAIYRLYNPTSGEHLYTSSPEESQYLSTVGWNDEGIGWYAPKEGEDVFRLFHAGISDHLYTKDTNETDTLVGGGEWASDFDGSAVFHSGGSLPVYRLYNDNNKRHHLTMDEYEYNTLTDKGWIPEGVSFSAAGEGVPKFPPTPVGPTAPTAGMRTVKNFLQTALLPVGQTLYVWGGGWNKPDNGAGEGSMTIGLHPNWKPFFDAHDASYDYNTTRFQINNGLDCSGFVGWTVYNTLNTESRGEGEWRQFGEVYGANVQAQRLAEKGYGTYTPYQQVRNYLPGDIVSLNQDGHVYISLGQCPDGSVVLVHSSPPGVMITGTLGPNGEQTQATQLSHEYMQRYYPEYYARYSGKLDRGYAAYITRSSKMTWGDNFVGDPDGIKNLSAPDALKVLFNEQ